MSIDRPERLRFRNPLAVTVSKRAQSVVKGAFSSAGTRLLAAAVGLINVPLGLHYLGPERYGVWTTIITTTSWIAILELGISSTLTNSISVAFANDDREGAARHTTNALAITLSLAALLGLILSTFWRSIDWMRVFNISPHVSAAEVQLTMVIAFAVVLITPTCTLVSKILSGYQESHIYGVISGAGSIGSLIGMAVGVRLHLAMPLLFLCSAGTTAFTGLLGLLWTLHLYKPWLRPRIAYLNMAATRSLLSSGSSFFLIQFASIVVFNSDNLVVGHYLGAAEVTPYSLAMRIMGYAQLLPTFIYPSLWPAYAEANARCDYDWIRRTFRRALVASLIILIFSLSAVSLWGRGLIRLWVGDTGVPSESLLVAMAVWTLISATTGVSGCLLSAVDRVRLQGILSCVAAVANLGLSIVLVQRIGAIGVVIGTVVSYILILVGPQIWEVRTYFSEMEKQAAFEHQGEIASNSLL